MNRQLLDAYAQVGMGWWSLLEKYIPAMQTLDPDCTFDVKEKYGTLRLQATPSDACEDHDAFWRLEEEAEVESKHTCEYCGKPGRLRTKKRSWYLTLCDECSELDKEAEYDLHLYERVLLGKKCEGAIGPERTKALRDQWYALPVKNTLRSEEFKAWYNHLTHDEQGAALGWNAEWEAYIRDESPLGCSFHDSGNM